MTAKTKTDTAKSFSLADFFTVPGASAGRKFPLRLPDGTATDHYLIVLGVDAPAVRKAMIELARTVRDEIKDDSTDEHKVEVRDRANLHAQAALVADWSFPQECTQEAVLDLLSNNPGLAREVDQLAGDRIRFFASESPSS